MPELASTFAALSDPTRLGIVDRLRQGEATAGELARPLPISPPAVSRHLKVLEGAGLISRRVQGQHRIFRLEPQSLSQVESWLARFREVLNDNYDRLDKLLAEEEGGLE